MPLRWGILATGRIAEKFARDLLLDPASRGVSDVAHKLVGIASSSSQLAAENLAQRVNAPSTCRVYDNYQDLVHDPEVDIVYIATPHSHHYQNAMLALLAGKHVLCEKPLTVNTLQAKKLFEVAAQKRLFLMEGMWTRFQPIKLEISRLIQNNAIGDVIRVIADNSLGVDPLTEFSPGDRLTRKELAGGALLDLGVYSINWVLQALADKQRHPLEVHSVMSKDRTTGVDNATSIVMKFAPGTTDAPAVVSITSASLLVADNYDGQTPVVRIEGNKGEIQIFGPSWRPSKVSLFERPQKFGASGTLVREIENNIPEGTHGLCYEADEVARCIRDGKLESPSMPWAETIIVMEIMDTIRRENGLWFPEEVESSNYPVDLSSLARQC